MFRTLEKAEIKALRSVCVQEAIYRRFWGAAVSAVAQNGSYKYNSMKGRLRELIPRAEVESHNLGKSFLVENCSTYLCSLSSVFFAWALINHCTGTNMILSSQKEGLSVSGINSWTIMTSTCNVTQKMEETKQQLSWLPDLILHHSSTSCVTYDGSESIEKRLRVRNHATYQNDIWAVSYA